jgi:hypothetical protein
MNEEREKVCFVSMPFGRKQSFSGIEYDFDEIYMQGIRPATQMAGVEAIRADMGMFGGIIHKPTFERIITADVMIADLTTGNPNVIYELGIRHAAKAGATVVIGAIHERLPFDIGMFRVLPYEVEDGKLAPNAVESFREQLSQQIVIRSDSQGKADSPLFMFIDGYEGVVLHSPERLPEIFISYAREDESEVRWLYDELTNRGFRPWLDQKNIEPGEKWELAIETAMRRADFILVCVSQRSSRKRGFVRKEIRRAVEESEEMLDSDIFLIPVRLEDCELPSELTAFQRVDLFVEDGMTRLTKAIKEGFIRRRT